MARKSIQKATQAHPLTIRDGRKYFDAKFTGEERDALRKRLMEICGYGPETDCSSIKVHDYLGFEHDILRPAEEEIWPAFRAQGLDYHRDGGRFCDYALIHICRQLEIDYKAFAKNEPELSIEGFIAFAKRAFPEFRRPRNKIEFKIQEHKLHLLWCDWHSEECARTGCTKTGHWLCLDRFANRDYAAILKQIAKHNETRPRLIAGKDALAAPAKIAVAKKPVLRIAVSNA